MIDGGTLVGMYAGMYSSALPAEDDGLETVEETEQGSTVHGSQASAAPTYCVAVAYSGVAAPLYSDDGRPKEDALLESPEPFRPRCCSS